MGHSGGDSVVGGLTLVLNQGPRPFLLGVADSSWLQEQEDVRTLGPGCGAALSPP